MITIIGGFINLKTPPQFFCGGVSVLVVSG
jgi:hypothetical protein